MSSPMRTVSRRPKLYWAQRDGFMWPGLYTWISGRHIRLLPIPATSNARASRRRQYPSLRARLRLWLLPQ